MQHFVFGGVGVARTGSVERSRVWHSHVLIRSVDGHAHGHLEVRAEAEDAVLGVLGYHASLGGRARVVVGTVRFAQGQRRPKLAVFSVATVLNLVQVDRLEWLGSVLTQPLGVERSGTGAKVSLLPARDV